MWYAEPHAGDFLVSIGGYHPYFKKPDHYPDLARVGCKALVYNFVHISVECFFACTPQALMAGASVSLWAEFEGIGAGLDVYLDVLINWDPFHILARLGVTVWFEFLGRHEIGVDLVIYTPPFGGSATIDLAIVSFTVSFGDDQNTLPPPKLHEFIASERGERTSAAARREPAAGTRGALRDHRRRRVEAAALHHRRKGLGARGVPRRRGGIPRRASRGRRQAAERAAAHAAGAAARGRGVGARCRGSAAAPAARSRGSHCFS